MFRDISSSLFLPSDDALATYTSGGRICPAGKLPDASRPPVGRTRGGETHPRPVYISGGWIFSGWKAARRKPSSRWSDSRRRKSSATGMYFRRLDFFRVESCPTQAVLPLVGLAAEKVIRDRYV
ncbi:MAG: hypothetical protein ACQESR_18635 [Planctomycetota bacterium]